MRPRPPLPPAGERARADGLGRTAGPCPHPASFSAASRAVVAVGGSGPNGEDGHGDMELGAPNLADAIWLYGSDKATIVEGLVNGRGGVMPAWGGRLDATTIKALTIYVHALGGGQ